MTLKWGLAGRQRQELCSAGLWGALLASDPIAVCSTILARFFILPCINGGEVILTPLTGYVPSYHVLCCLCLFPYSADVCMVLAQLLAGGTQDAAVTPSYSGLLSSENKHRLGSQNDFLSQQHVWAHSCGHMHKKIANTPFLFSTLSGEAMQADTCSSPCFHRKSGSSCQWAWVNKHVLKHIWNSAMNFSAFKLHFLLDYLPTVFFNSWLILGWLFNTLFG